MAPPLTPKRLAFLRRAADHPKGSILPMLVTDAGVAMFLRGADETALKELGYADSIDDCGHVQGSPDHEHRSHPHLFRITDAGRQAVQAADPATSGKEMP
ncbi:hypothetical protein ACIOUE_37975 [Streptomyces xanthochromogenes]|uniref:hypothetical protein n=1 Tax=Streptomyces xanthochromogenes TaxID=67384 RepID=UPI0037FEA9CB